MANQHDFFRATALLSNEEYDHFLRFAAACLPGGRQKDLLLFLDNLPKILINQQEPTLDQIAHYLAAATDASVSVATISRWVSASADILNDFLCLLELRQDPHARQQLLRNFLSRKGETITYEQIWTQHRQKIQSGPEDARFHHRLWAIDHERSLHPLADDFTDEAPDAGQTIAHLERGFVLQRLLYRLNELNETKIYDISAPAANEMIKAVWSHFRAHYPPGHHLRDMLEQLAELMVNPKDEARFQQTKHTLLTHLRLFSPQDANLFLRQLLNIVNRQSRLGDTRMLRESLELYKEGLRTGVLLTDNQLPPKLLINIQATADGLQQYEWVEEFLNTYSSRLKGPMSAAAAQLAQSGHWFMMGSDLQESELLQKSLKCLPDGHLPLWYSLRRYSIEIRAHYELFAKRPEQDVSYLMPILDKYNKYLQRKSLLNNNTKLYYLQGLRYLKKLILLHKQPRAKILNEQPKLYAQIESDTLAWKSWLLQKTAGLASRQDTSPQNSNNPSAKYQRDRR